MGEPLPNQYERELGIERIRRIRDEHPDIVVTERADRDEQAQPDHDPESCAYCLGLDCWTCTTLGRDLYGCDHEPPQRHGAPPPADQDAVGE